MGVGLYQYKPVVQKQGGTGRNAHIRAGSPPPGAVQVARMPRQSLSRWWLKMGVLWE